MPRTKRKRAAAEVAPDAPPPVATRRRRSTAGHEPNSSKKNEGEDNNRAADAAAVAAVAAAGNDTAARKADRNTTTSSKTTKNNMSDRGNKNKKKNVEATTELPQQGTKPQPDNESEGNDHAEIAAEEKKTAELHQTSAAGVESSSIITAQQLPTGGGGGQAGNRNMVAKKNNRNQKQTRRTSTPSAGLLSTNPSIPPGSPPAIDSATKKARIRILLEHRKLLLKRVRQGRTAAQQRADDLIQKDPSRREQTEEQEVTSFQEMTKMVSSMARKQARLEHEQQADSQQRRPSVSLRRGSSVGKRMNAALTSLVGGPGGTAATAAAAEEGQQSQLKQHQSMQQQQYPIAATTAAQNADVPVVTVPSKQPKRGRPSSAAGRGGGPKQAATAAGRGSSSTGIMNQQHPKHQQQLQQQGRQLHQKQLQHKQHQQQHHQLQQQQLGVQQQRRLPTQTAAPFAPPPAVVCPEAMALRERRDTIRIKLATMLQQRHGRSEGGRGHDAPSRLHERRSSTLSVASISSQNQRRLPPPSPKVNRGQKRPRNVPHRPLWQGPDPPPTLPQRRKTHWDTMLEEMRWMATDFQQERRWKNAISRVLVKEAAQACTIQGSPLKESPLKESPLKEQKSVAICDRTIIGDDAQGATPMSDEIAADRDSGSPMHIDEESRQKTTVSKSAAKVNNSDSARIDLASFHEPTLVDEKSSRDIARLLSGSVKMFVAQCIETDEQVPQVPGGGADGPTEEEGGSATVSPLNSTKGNGPASSKTNDSKTDLDADTRRKEKEAFMMNASAHVDRILKTVEETTSLKGGKVTAGRIQNSAKTHGYPLSSEQLKIVEAVESLWQKVESGAVLRGPNASGKTIATCSLLWRTRSLGPQLIICSPVSMVRWLHELKQFPGWTVRLLVDSIELGSVLTEKSELSTIFVTQHALVARMDEAALAQISSVVIDCRHPAGLSASGPNAYSEIKDEAVPTELCLTSWWNQIADIFSRSNVNRLLLEKLEADGSPFFLRGLQNRQLLSLQALRVCFLFGAKTFASPIYDLERAVLAWSRHKIKDSKKAGSKFQRVAAILGSLIEPFLIDSKVKSASDKGKDSIDDMLSWEVRLCEMPYLQNEAYQRTSRDAATALSRMVGCSDAPRFDNFDEVASSLLQLRRICFHSTIDESLRRDGPLVGSVLSPTLGCFGVRCNASQPDIDVAREVTTGSGKLQELLSFLNRECGYVFPDEQSVDFVAESDSIASDNDGPKRVVILAGLPDFQLLLSVLFNALGIRHEILLEPKCDAPIDKSIETASWGRCQQILSSFNGGDSRTAASLIVTSPVVAAGDHGGLGVDSADVVLCLDDDWSGRGELVMRALMERCRFRRLLKNKEPCRFLKLVSKETCEETFLRIGDDQESTEHGSDVPNGWKVDAFGVIKALDFYEDAGLPEPRRTMFGFPGTNLLCYRNTKLDEVLHHENRKSFLGSFGDLRFLPTDDETSTESSFAFVRRLLNSEDAASRSLIAGASGACGCAFGPILPPPPSTFGMEYLTSLDLSDFLLRQLGRRIGKARSLDEFNTAEGSDVVSPNDPMKSIDLPRSDSQEYVQNLQEKLSSRSSEAVASSILLYNARDPLQLENLKTKQQHSKFLAAMTRTNLYSSLFSSVPDITVSDGSMGSEILVYFPPIFPRMQECARLAKRDVSALSSRSPSSIGPTVFATDTNTTQSNQEAMDVDRVITEDEASHSDAASVLIDLSDDYGIAGMGAVPLPRDSALAAAKTSYQPSTIVMNTTQSNWFSSAPVCDPEEWQSASQIESKAADAGSMILLVSRKRPRGYQLAGRGSFAGNWNGVSGVASAPSFYSDMNGTGKKGKRNSSAFNPLPSQPARPSAPQLLKGKDIHRRRLLSSLRQSGIGATMFEAPIFRVASVRVRNKISDRILRHAWTGAAYSVGPGLPSLLSKQHSSSPAVYRGMFEVDPALWTSIVKRLKNKNTTTGAEAIELSLAQRAALRRSLVAPCRVDFGPFQCGFLSQTSGMTTAAPPRPRVGVSLPMGVKITHASKDQQLVPWNDGDDQALDRAAVRFGMNWILASRVLSGYQDLTICSEKESLNYRHRRAARSCRDRWQELARKNPSLVMNVRQSERFSSRADCVPDSGSAGRRVRRPRDKEDSELSSKTAASAVEFLLADPDGTQPAEKISTTVGDQKQEEEKPKPLRRQFNTIKAARMRHQSFPKTIPGVPIGSPPSVVPSHPSHDLAVKSSVSAVWTGAADMWPLPLLDKADEQRIGHKAAAISDGSAKTSTAVRQTKTQAPPRSGKNGASTSSNRSQQESASKQKRKTASSDNSSSHKPSTAAKSSAGGSQPTPTSSQRPRPVPSATATQNAATTVQKQTVNSAAAAPNVSKTLKQAPAAPPGTTAAQNASNVANNRNATTNNTSTATAEAVARATATTAATTKQSFAPPLAPSAANTSPSAPKVAPSDIGRSGPPQAQT